MKSVPVIDYSSHPAFSAYYTRMPYDYAEIDSVVGDIDMALAIDLVRASDIAELRAIFENTVSNSIDKLKKHIKSICPSIIAVEVFSSAIDWSRNELLKESIRNFYRQRYNRVDCDKSFLKDIENDGMHIVAFSESTMQEMRSAAAPYYNRLKEKAVNNPGERSFESVNMKDALGKSIYKMIAEANILPVLSNYMNTELEVMGVGIEYAFDGQTWYKGCYSDIGVDETSLSYMHFDEASYCPKTLCYITPVESPDNGATKYIPGSHKWKRSEFITLFHKALDRILIDRYAGVFDSYYRPMFKHIELRKLLVQLPITLVGTSHCGDDIFDGTELSKELLELEATFLTKGCEAVVFDGGRGYHRGATVKKGERLSLQIIYWGKNEPKIDMLSKNETSLGLMKKSYRTLRRALKNL